MGIVVLADGLQWLSCGGGWFHIEREREREYDEEEGDGFFCGTNLLDTEKWRGRKTEREEKE